MPLSAFTGYCARQIQSLIDDDGDDDDSDDDDDDDGDGGTGCCQKVQAGFWTGFR